MNKKISLKSKPELPFDPVKSAWEAVVLKNQPPKDPVSPIVLQSWQKSLKIGIDPYSTESPNALSGNKLKQLVAKNKSLLDIAKPIMQMIEISVRDTKFLTTLSDKSGYVLLVHGQSDILEMAHRNYYLPGCSRNIQHAGTNGIGLCLQEKKPIQLTGCEHFRVKHHDWTCSTAPIQNSKGNILGTLTLSGHSTGRHQHTLALVTAAAKSIETQLREYELIEEKQLLDSLVSSIFNSITDGLIAIDSHLSITHMNSQAQKMLCTDMETSLGQRLDDIVQPDEALLSALRTNYRISNKEIDFNCNGEHRSYVCSIAPIQDASDQTLGKIITLVKKRDVINITKKFGGKHAKYEFGDIKGNDPDLKKQIELAKITAKTNSRVLLFGESGTGKELFAQAIHNHSDRCEGPFVALSCATIPHDLFESELFGYRQGAFTGARQDGMIGKFELANNGSLFLDEINSLPLSVQAKLLRVLQQGEITRLGDTRTIPINVRVITATNTDLLDEVANQNFREDLYYRINVIEVIIPSLRSRKGDLDLLIDIFVDRLCQKMSITKPEIPDEIMGILSAYEWPGNVRELENCIERAVTLSQGETIQKQHLPIRIIKKQNCIINDSTSIQDGYKFMIKSALERCDGNASQAARDLNIARSTLYRKMEEFAIRQ